MKRKTKRKIKRFFETPLNILGTVFTIGGVIAAILAVSLGWGWLIVLFVILILSGGGLLYTYKKVSAPELNYFERIDFRIPDENTIREAVDGILNCKKVEPFYVHVAPKFNEVSAICSRSKETGFTMVSGRPGEGKSMIAYQAAHSQKEQELYFIYSLNTGEIEDKKWGEIRDQIFLELDEVLKGKRKLILVDDAHKLESKKDLKRALQREAEENNCNYIWIETEEETEEEYEGTRSDKVIRINFQSFLNSLLKDFYQSEEPSLQRALAGRIEGLEDAIKRVNEGKITDAWHFAFCATQGWERLVQKVKDFKKDEIVKLLVLFFISAHAVLSNESELHEKYVMEKIRGLGFKWLSEQKPQMSIPEAIDSLGGEKLIRIYDKKHDRGYIRSLHYNFAREVVKASLLRESYADDMLILSKALLTDDYQRCVGYRVFHHDIGRYAPQFDRDNKDWLVNFISNPLTEWLVSYPIVLDSIRKVDSDAHNEILNELDISTLAAKVNTIESDKFQALAHLLNALGDHGDELLKDENFDLSNLAQKASASEVGQFQQLAYLLNAL